MTLGFEKSAFFLSVSLRRALKKLLKIFKKDPVLKKSDKKPAVAMVKYSKIQYLKVGRRPNSTDCSTDDRWTPTFVKASTEKKNFPFRKFLPFGIFTI